MPNNHDQSTKKVFVLVEGHGAYSDRYEYPIAAFTSKNAAWEYADHLPKRRKELMDRFSREDCPEQEAKLILLELGVSLHDWEGYVKNRQRDRPTAIGYVTQEPPRRREWITGYCGDLSDYDYEVNEVPLLETA